MMIKKTIPDFWGDCQIITSLNLEELADKISNILFGGSPFIHGKNSIWEEIPSMYIESPIIGMLIIIGGYGGKEGYTLRVEQFGEFGRYIHSNKIKEERIELDLYLFHLLKDSLKNYPEIKIIEPEE
jgi:hypothetical protein